MNTSDLVNSLKSAFTTNILNEINFRCETTLEISKSVLKDVLKDAKNSGFDVLMDLTGIDYLIPTPITKIVYLLHNSNNNQRIRIIINIQRDEEIPSVSDIWEGANWYERELYDMFGVKFIFHPDLKRILMPDDWIGHPMQRNYTLTEVPVQFKHNVKPKVPSEIIHYDKKNCK